MLMSMPLLPPHKPSLYRSILTKEQMPDFGAFQHPLCKLLTTRQRKSHPLLDGNISTKNIVAINCA